MRSASGCPGHESQILWLWNGDLSTKSLERDLETFGGPGGVIVSAGWGLREPFLGDSWMRALRVVSARARALEIPIFLRDDEDTGRSGSAGGWVTASDEHRLRALRIRETEILLPMSDRSDILVFRIRRDGPWLLDYRFVPPGTPLPELAADETFLLFDIVHCADLPRFNGGGAPNALCENAVRAFLDRVHGRTWDALGSDPGRSLKGFVQGTPTWNLRDEDRGPPLTLPWASRLGREIEDEHRVDVLGRLPELLFRTRDRRHRDVRWAYRETLTRRLNRSYGQIVARWCASRNLVLTACFEKSGSLKAQVQSTGVAMRQFETVHEPTVSISLRGRLPLLAMVQCASIARIMGRIGGVQLNVPEDATVPDIVSRAEVAMVLGLFRRVIGPVPQGLRGRRKVGAGLHLGSPIWRFHEFWERRLRTLADALSADMRHGDIAVLHPVESAWVVVSPRDPDPVDRMDQGLETVVRTLVDGQRSVDLFDEDQLGRIATVGTGPRICMGSVEASVLILPPLVRLRRETIRIIERFLDRGGTVLAVRASVRMAMSPDPSVAALLRDTRIRPVPLAAVPDVLMPTLDEVAPAEIFIRNLDGSRTSQVWMRIVHGQADRSVCLLSRDSSRPQVVQVHGLRSVTGKPRSVRLEPAGTVVLSDECDAPGDRVKVAVSGHRARVLELGPPDSVRAEGAMVRPLDQVRCRVEDGPWSEESDFESAVEQIAIRSGHPWDPRRIGAQPWAHAQRGVSGRGVGDPERQVGAIGFEAGRTTDNFRVGLSYAFRAEEMPADSVGLVVEDWHRWRVSVNGIVLDSPDVRDVDSIPADLDSAIGAGWWLDRALCTRLLGPHLVAGLNVVEIHGKCGSGSELQAPQLIGTFSFSGNVLRPAPVIDGFGCVEAQGWAPPLGAVVYRWTMDRIPSHHHCRLEWVPEGGKPAAAGFEVRIDGRRVATIPWAPYAVDLGNRLADDRSHEVEIVCATTFGPIGAPEGRRDLGLRGTPRLFFEEIGS